MPEPSLKLRQPGLVVYGCGIATSLFAIWVVNVMQAHDENPMGWYANGIIPVGAFLVGLASGLGYSLASYFFNVKLSRSFLMFMLLTGVLDYASMQFVTYADLIEKAHIDPSRYTFISWFREAAEGMVFKRQSSADTGSALGMWGYGFRVLELAGFSLGVVTPCAVVLGKPYCRSCQKYLKPHMSRKVSSSVLLSDWKKNPRKERPAFLRQALTVLLEQVQPLVESLRPLPLCEVRSMLESTGEAKAVRKSVGVVNITVNKCPLCDSHHITAVLTNVTDNGKYNNSNFAVIDKPVTASALEAA